MAGKKTLVLLSGGIDSCVALYWARNKGIECSSLSFLYPRQPAGEKKSIERICRDTNIKHYSVQHPLIIHKSQQIKDFSPDNLLYYAIATYFARNNGFSYIIGGQNKDDREYSRDALPNFYKQFNNLLKKGYGSNNPLILQPLSDLSKFEIVKLGISLGAPLSTTWSCQENGKNPCRDCPPCRTRKAISASLNIKL